MAKIGYRLTLGFLIIIVLSVAMGSLSFFNLIILEENFKFLIEHDLNVLQNAQKLQRLIVDSETGQRGFIITGDESYLEPYYSGIFQFDDLLEVEKELVSHDSLQVQRLERISEKFNEWQEKAARPEIELARTIHQSTLSPVIPSNVAFLLQVGTGKNILDEIRSEFTDFLLLENTLKDARYQSAQITAKNTENAISIFLAISIGVGLFTAFSTSRSVTKPIKYLKQAADKVGKGNLDFEISSKSNDEIGELALQFNEMRKSIKKSTEKLELAYKQLKTVDRQKEEFQSMVAHELKTPLTPIIGYADALKMPGIMGKLSAEQFEAVSEISNNSKILQQLINDIFDAQKLDLGRMNFNLENFLVYDLTNDIINNSKFIAKEKNIQIICSDKKEIVIKSDKNRISQVLTNIINNAAEFVPKETGVIRLSVGEVNKSVVFSIKDNGSGIPKDLQKNLFQKFYQVDSSKTRSHGGSGLGLAISKGIVDNLGGKIWLESEAGNGCEFFVKIPKDRKKGKE